MKPNIILRLIYSLLIVITISCVNETTSIDSANIAIDSIAFHFSGGDPRGNFSANTPFYVDISVRPPPVPPENDTVWSMIDSVVYNTGTGYLALNGSSVSGNYSANNFSINYLGYSIQIATNNITGGSKRQVVSQLSVPILPSSFSSNGQWIKLDSNKIGSSPN